MVSPSSLSMLLWMSFVSVLELRIGGYELGGLDWGGPGGEVVRF